MTSKVIISRTKTPRQRLDGAKDERFADSNIRRALSRKHKAEPGACFDADAVYRLGA